MGFRYGDDSGDSGVTFAGPAGQIDVADANNEGASSSASRADHQHAFPAPTGPPPDLAAAGAAGASARVARQDHTHAHTAAQHRSGGHADLTGDFAAIGAPGAAVAAHEGAADPHPAYQLEATALQAAQVVLQALADAKGDLAVASAADTFARLTVGTDGQLLAADSTEPLGLKWIAPPEGGATDHGALTGLGDDDHPHYAKLTDLPDPWAPGDAEIYTDAVTATHTGSTVMTKVKEAELGHDGSLRIAFTLAETGGPSSGGAEAQIFRNGVAVGTLRAATSSSTFSEDIAGWSSGDLLQVFARPLNAARSADVSNLAVSTARAPYSIVKRTV